MNLTPREPGSIAPPRLNPGDGVTARLLAHAPAGPFMITHKRYTADFDQAWHEHPVASIDFVLAGGGRGAYQGQDIPAGAGGLGFFRHEMKHRFTSGPQGIRSMHVSIPSEVIRDAGVPYDLCSASLRSTPAVRTAVRMLRELHEPGDSSRLLQLESLAHDLLQTVCEGLRTERRVAGFLATAHEVLHESVASDAGPGRRSEAVSLSTLAEICQVHPGHLARTFKRHFGVTAGEYHRRLRVLRASRLLAQTREPVSRVSRITGFADQAHLTRAMRAGLGVTPSALRAQLAGNR